jgi:hypothetical protein
MDTLPELCVYLVAESLKQKCTNLRELIQVSANLSKVGNATCTSISEMVNEFVDPGCTMAKKEAVEKNIQAHAEWKQEIIKLQKYPKEKISTYTLAELREECKRFKISRSGTKSIIQHRLLSYIDMRIPWLENIYNVTKISKHCSSIRSHIRKIIQGLQHKDDKIATNDAIRMFDLKLKDMKELFPVEIRNHRKYFDVNDVVKKSLTKRKREAEEHWEYYYNEESHLKKQKQNVKSQQLVDARKTMVTMFEKENNLKIDDYQETHIYDDIQSYILDKKPDKNRRLTTYGINYNANNLSHMLEALKVYAQRKSTIIELMNLSYKQAMDIISKPYVQYRIQIKELDIYTVFTDIKYTRIIEKLKEVRGIKPSMFPVGIPSIIMKLSKIYNMTEIENDFENITRNIYRKLQKLI